MIRSHDWLTQLHTTEIPLVSPILQVAVDPLPRISVHNITSDLTEDLYDHPMAQDNSDFPLAENLLDHPGSNPSLLTKDLIMDFSIDPDLCDSPIDRPPVVCSCVSQSCDLIM